MRTLALSLSCTLLLSGTLCVAQNRGSFAGSIDVSAGPPTVPSNTGYLGGGIAPLDAHTRDANGHGLDLNGDGKADAIVAADCSDPVNGAPGIVGCPSTGYAIVAYLGNGDGTFQLGIFSTSPVPAIRSFAVGDFNGDGKTDVAVASDCLSTQDCSSGTLILFVGNGDGTFSSTQVIASNGIASAAGTIAVGDFNGDGKLDVALGQACYNIPVNGCSVGAVEVFFGNGDGTVSAPTAYTTVGNSALYPAVADFNNDGKLDIVAGGLSSLTVLLGDGSGTFTESTEALSLYGLSAVTAVDLNLDGKMDLAVTASNQTVNVFTGNGDGTFSGPTTYSTGLGLAVTDGAPVVAADFNQDGKPDLVVSGTLNSFNGAAVLLNDGTGNFVLGGSFTAGGWLYAFIDSADFNGDGRPDLFLASGCSEDPQIGDNCPDGTLNVLIGEGDGDFRSAQYLAADPNPIGNRGVVAADFDGDGKPDLAYASASSGSSGFTLLLSNGGGAFAPSVQFLAPVTGSSFLSVGDFNSDGKPDVASFNACDASCTQTSVSVFLNTGAGTFASPVVYEGGGVTSSAIVTGDFNGDGKLDLAVLNGCGLSCTGQSLVSVLLGNGDGTFNVGPSTSLSAQAYWMAAADFNHDGKADLVIGQASGLDPYSAAAQVLLSNGDGSFSVAGSYLTGSSSVVSVATGDFNGDGKADILIGGECDPITGDFNCARGELGVLLGNGDGTFITVINQVVPDGNLWATAAADVNGDGKLDAVASTNTGILVAFGNGDGSFQAPVIYAALLNLQNAQLAVADLNGDGGLDIVEPGYNGQLAILYNQGFGKSTSSVALQSSANPSVFNQPVSLVALIAPEDGTGTVTFKDGTTTLGTVNLVNGAATSVISTLQVGSHSITAVYSGDANTSGSTSPVISQVVNKAGTTNTIISSPNPSFVGQKVTLTSTVTGAFGGLPTGNVIFKAGSTSLGSATLNNGQAVLITTFTTSGTRSITATYSGDTNYLSSTSSPLSQSVKKVPTTTTVTSSLNPSVFGQSVTFTATITSSSGTPPNGETVTFKDGTTILGTGLTAGGTATFATSTLKVGSHSITATYAGDTKFATSTSVKLTQTVNKATTTTAISSSQNPSTFGQPVTLQATVASQFGGLVSGTVTFKDGATTLQTVTISSGQAMFTTSTLSRGTHSISSSYNGDVNNQKSSASLTQRVN